MTRPARIAEVRLDRLQVTPRTVWIFLGVTTDDGRTGWGEATLPRDPAAVARAAEVWLDELMGLPLDRAARIGADRTGIAHAALRSSLDMALHDLEGQRCGQPIHALLGGARRDKVLLYANINRRTTPRTPEAFAASARLAADRGYGIFKLAPFDEVTPAACRQDDFDALLQPGLERIAATRAAIGADATLRVDCHWRFDHAGAERMIDACSAFGLDWIECPVAEDVGAADAIAALRSRSNAHGIRLAGLETGIGLAAFAPFLTAGAYDVIMPDVKYLGGLGLFAELGDLARRHGAVLSPHNPSGPVCHAASLHVACALAAVDSLEVQFDETPLFDALVSGAFAPTSGGLAPVPQAAGLGVVLDQEWVCRLRLAEDGKEGETVTETAPLKRYELRAALGESPVWCARSQRLWFVDIRAPALYRLDPASGAMDRYAMADLVGMVVMATEGLVVGVGAALCRFDPDRGKAGPPFLQLDPDHPGNRINDTKAGPDGALWCGTMPDGGGEPTGSLYRIAGDGQVATLASGIAVPNALCFSPDGASVYFTDTRVGVILRADARAAHPVFEDFAGVDVAPGRPDGATVDSEGYLWNARYGGGCVARISPRGDLDRLIQLPVTQPTACAFGGPDLRTLFITTARQRLSEADCAEQPDAGDLFALACDVAGLPEPRFALAGNR